MNADGGLDPFKYVLKKRRQAAWRELRHEEIRLLLHRAPSGAAEAFFPARQRTDRRHSAAGLRAGCRRARILLLMNARSAVARAGAARFRPARQPIRARGPSVDRAGMMTQ